MSETPEARTEFDYLLNRFEHASQAAEPAKHNYSTHRKALYAYVRDLESRAALRQGAQRAGERCTSISVCNNLAATMELIVSIAEGSTTANSLPHIAKIGREALAAGGVEC